MNTERNAVRAILQLRLGSVLGSVSRLCFAEIGMTNTLGLPESICLMYSSRGTKTTNAGELAFYCSSRMQERKLNAICMPFDALIHRRHANARATFIRTHQRPEETAQTPQAPRDD